MTPPSTFQIAPVTQLVAGERRKVMVLARSRAVPTRPERMEAVEAVQGLVELVLGDELLVDGRGDDGGCDRVDTDVVRSQLDRERVRQRVQPAFARRVAGRRGRRDALVGPHAADVDDRAALALLDHPADDRLSEEKIARSSSRYES